MASSSTAQRASTARPKLFWTLGTVAPGLELRFRDLVEWQHERDPDNAPQIYVAIRKERRWLKRARKFMHAERPAFERYVFLHVDHESHLTRYPRLSRIRSHIVQVSPGVPVVLRASEIERVRRLEAEGAFSDLPDEASLRFSEGNVLFVYSGPLAGQNVRVVKTVEDATRHVEVALAFGGRTSVRVPVESFNPGC